MSTTHQTAQSEPRGDGGADSGTTGEPLLSVRGLRVEFPGSRHASAARVLRDVDLDVNAGETVAVVGESGSGKSMTALSILGLVPPPGLVVAGSIRFGSRDLLQLKERQLRDLRGNRIAMIFQEPMTSLNPVLTIGRQVAEPIRIHRGVSWKEATERAAELLRQVAIPDAEQRLDSYPHEFSGGMRQRVMIAMALSCDPDLILADEPTTALDVTVQAQILELLQRLTHERGTSLLLITHDLGVVARYADRVAVMYAGNVVESAPAASLYERPQHPYTQGLLRCIPRLDGNAGERLVPIEGQPPDLARTATGACAFAPRCPIAHDRCRAEQPELVTIDGVDGGGHRCACWGPAP